MEPELRLNNFDSTTLLKTLFTIMIDQQIQKFTDHKWIFVAKMVD